MKKEDVRRWYVKSDTSPNANAVIGHRLNECASSEPVTIEILKDNGDIFRDEKYYVPEKEMPLILSHSETKDSVSVFCKFPMEDRAKEITIGAARLFFELPTLTLSKDEKTETKAKEAYGLAVQKDIAKRLGAAMNKGEKLLEILPLAGAYIGQINARILRGVDRLTYKILRKIPNIKIFIQDNRFFARW